MLAETSSRVRRPLGFPASHRAESEPFLKSEEYPDGVHLRALHFLRIEGRLRLRRTHPYRHRASAHPSGLRKAGMRNSVSLKCGAILLSLRSSFLSSAREERTRTLNGIHAPSRRAARVLSGARAALRPRAAASRFVRISTLKTVRLHKSHPLLALVRPVPECLHAAHGKPPSSSRRKGTLMTGRSQDGAMRWETEARGKQAATFRDLP